ncbi:MAG: hypothetical protein J6E46_08430 [Faecalicoccus sp.]|nr:hypothetical protein [Faecalicoccus sp.]
MDEEKVMLTDLIRDSLNYELEQVHSQKEEIDRIEKLIHANNQYIRKISLQDDVDHLNNILMIQQELKEMDIGLDIFQNEENYYGFMLNGQRNDILCDSIKVLRLCINALLIGLKRSRAQ